MNQKNFDYLKDQVKFTGFGEGLQSELKEKMQKQNPEFTINHTTKFGNDTVSSALYFKKSAQNDMYFFNSYHVNQKKENNSEKMEQTFYINNKGNNVTLEEAYNLMNGRSVNKDLTTKDGQMYNAWVQLDFKQTENNGNYKMKQFHQNYGFELEKELAKHPIKELSSDLEKNQLLESLKKGNSQMVSIMNNGSEQKSFIEANPQFKTINVYDSNMQRISFKQHKEEKLGQGEANTTKQDIKKEKNSTAGDDDSFLKPKSEKKRSNLKL